MFIFLTFIHVVVCIFLIIVVLLQSGKAADLAGAFGGMGSQTAFGPRGSATLLSKATTISAVVFMLTSLSLSILATRSSGVGTTVLEQTPATKTLGSAGAGEAAPRPRSRNSSRRRRRLRRQAAFGDDLPARRRRAQDDSVGDSEGSAEGRPPGSRRARSAAGGPARTK